MAVLARQRRRLAAAALAGSLAAGPSAALAQPRHAGRALALVLRALEDEPAFQVRPVTLLRGMPTWPGWARIGAVGAARARGQAGLPGAPLCSSWRSACKALPQHALQFSLAHEHAQSQGHAEESRVVSLRDGNLSAALEA